MTYPHSNFERRLLDNAARRAVESHGRSEHSLDPETRGMKAEEHTGIELTGVDLAYFKKMLFDRIETIKNSILPLQRSLNEGSAPNRHNAEEELKELEEELAFVQHNLAEKLFKKEKGRADNEESV